MQVSNNLKVVEKSPSSRIESASTFCRKTSCHTPEKKLPKQHHKTNQPDILSTTLTLKYWLELVTVFNTCGQRVAEPNGMKHVQTVLLYIWHVEVREHMMAMQWQIW